MMQQATNQDGIGGLVVGAGAGGVQKKSSDRPGSYYRQNLMDEDATSTAGGGDCRRRGNLKGGHTATSFHEDHTSASNSGETEAKESDQGGQYNRTTDGQTMMHILKANIGTGVLALPLAFKNVGLWCGLVLVPVIGFICIHCMNILIHSHNNLCDRFNYESLDYDQVASLGLACGPRWARRFAKKAGVIVTIFLMLTQIGFCCVYILFTVENLQVACMNLFGLHYSMLTYLLAVFPVIGLTSCTSNLKHLARISTLANILQLVGLALIFFDLLQFHTYAQIEVPTPEAATTMTTGDETTTTMPTASLHVSPKIVVDQGLSQNIAQGLPLFFATAVYAFEGIGVVLPLVKEMQSPQRILGFNGVLNTSMALVALLYMAMGFFGYAKYGQTVAGSITLNLPESTLNEIVRLAFALAIGLSYGLQFYIPWAYFWPLIDEALFYSYRPRAPRNKLSFLNKLSAENHWALSKVMQEVESERQESSCSSSHHLATGGNKSSPPAQNDLADSADADGRLPPPTGCVSATTSIGPSGVYNDNSMATTMATSYSMSMSTNFQAAAAAGANNTRPLLLQVQGQPQKLQVTGGPSSASQYGTMRATSADLLSVRRPLHTSKRVRNRFEDVIERSADDDSMMPEVEWRPPPRSMRGKRKLVRYTVILLTVSFTFVAAALIPRLDLFISLIGALASSCLAIIFPAIIQLCTYWNWTKAQEEDEEQDSDSRSDSSDGQHEAGSGLGSAHGQLLHTGTQQLALGKQQQCKLWQTSKRQNSQRRRKWRRSLAWHLFLLKNLFLIVFGFAGLITGTWVSLRQLGALGAQV